MAENPDGSRNGHAPTARLAAWCAGTSRQWSAACENGARRAFIDTIAVMLAGQAEDCTVSARNAVAGWDDGPCRIIGGGRAAAPWAALVNGTAAHALDYDDVLEPALSHPSAALVPAILALAEAQDASGADALDAFLVGFEVLARLGEAMNRVHYHRGWHTTLSLGAIGVAAACARLLRLDAERMASAISLATSMAGGSKRQFGSMAKPLHAGLAAKNGLVAAQLAAHGLAGIAEPLDGRWGYLDLMAGETAPGLAGPLAKLGGVPAMEEHGISAKAYPCCAATHRPIDALRSLNVRPEEVASIEAAISAMAAANLRYRIPANPNEARFSLPYCLAVTLAEGMPSVASFSAGAVGRPALLPLMERVAVVIDPTQPADGPIAEGHERGTVTVRLRDGSVKEATTLVPRGHATAPLTDAELEAKFRDCAAEALPPAAVTAVLDHLSRLPRLNRLSELTDAVADAVPART